MQAVSSYSLTLGPEIRLDFNVTPQSFMKFVAFMRKIECLAPSAIARVLGGRCGWYWFYCGLPWSPKLVQGGHKPWPLESLFK